MQGAITSSSDREIVTAVKFLEWFSVRGYPESNLKKYLADNRKLNGSQIDEAFRLYHAKNTNIDADNPAADSRINQFHNHVSFLIRERQTEGKKLVQTFLKDDGEYCAILQCLHEDYFKKLCKMADEGTFQMSREEVDKIFRHIPTLYEFHKVFNADLNRACNVGWMFVGLFIFFHGYVDYMKDCLYAIKKMREYIRDTKLHDCMTQIRRQSKRRKDNMIDLLLVPLNRIQEYKKFLDQMYEWGDKSKEADYEFLGKASRRIGRVASYIGQYKHGISNRNEMNKVQLFVGSQCSVLHPNRLIVRRGMMNCGTFELPERKMFYMFFLFNDILLWTTKESKNPNFAELWNTKVTLLGAKEEGTRKFKLISGFGKNPQVLILECKSERQRDGWYNAIQSGISASKDTKVEAWSTLEEADYSAKEKHEETNKISSESKIDENENIPWRKVAKTKSNEQAAVAKKERPQKFKIGHLDEAYPKLENYGSTRSFQNQEFEEFHPLSRTLSTNSIQDFGFYNDHKQGEKTGNNMPVSGVNDKKVKITVPERKKDDSSEFTIRRNAYGCATSLHRNFFISNPNSRRPSITNGTKTPRTVFFDQRLRLRKILGKTVMENEVKLDTDVMGLRPKSDRSSQNLQGSLSREDGDMALLRQLKDKEDESSKSDSSSIRCVESPNTMVRRLSARKQKRRVSMSLRLDDVNVAYTK